MAVKRSESLATIEMTVNLISVLVAMLIVYVLIDTSLNERENQRTAALRSLNSLVDLASENISRALSGSRETMRLITRMPPMRATRRAGALATFYETRIASAVEMIPEIVTSTAMFLTTVHESRRRDANARLDWSLAALRRAGHSLGLPVEAVADEPSANTTTPVVPPSSLPELIHDQVLEFLAGVHRLMISNAQLIDGAVGLGKTVPEDIPDVQRLLNTSVSDMDLIRSVQLRTLEGENVSSVSEGQETIGFLSGWTKKAARSSRSFYPGPVWFDEALGRPFWQAGQLVRDRDWRPYAVLTTQIDLSFLSDLIQKSRLSSSSYLFIVDEEGIVISHPKASVVANQVNALHGNPAVAEVLKGIDGAREIQIGGASYFAAFRALKNLDKVHLPGWGILYVLPVSEVFSGPFEMFARTILWLLIAFYALFYVNDLILTSLEEEWGT